MGACCMKDIDIYADNNEGLALKNDDDIERVSGKEIFEGVLSCFFNKNHIQYHTGETENIDGTYNI